jgi:hypothetical protein
MPQGGSIEAIADGNAGAWSRHHPGRKPRDRYRAGRREPVTAQR